MGAINQPSAVDRQWSLCPRQRSLASEAIKQFYMCDDDVVIGNSLGVHSNVSHEAFVSLVCRDVIRTFLASPVQHIQSCILGGAEERIQQCKSIIFRKGKEPLTIFVYSI